jgi:putative Holliday junction resolvase
MAVTDATGVIPQALPAVRRTETEDDLAAIATVVHEREVHEIVLGFPKRMDDSLGPAAEKAAAFAAMLKARLALPVHLVDERLTSAYARRLMAEAGVPTPRKRLKEHGFAAQILLSTFLGQRRRQKG